MQADEVGGLAALGLTAVEDGIYRALVGVPDSSAREVADWLQQAGESTTSRDVASALGRLVERGLVIPAGGSEGCPAFGAGRRLVWLDTSHARTDLVTRDDWAGTC